jgi:hypothetical protein
MGTGMTTKPTPQGISRLLAKAGFTRSELYPKGPRRGEVRIGGFHVAASITEPAVLVRYWPLLGAGLAANHAMLVRYTEALPGYEVEMRRHELVVTAKAEDQTATKTRQTRPDRTPADVTRRFPTCSGRMEAWQAISRDGAWRYDRLEVSGTPWMVVHLPTSIEGDYHGTLNAAREATADGRAMATVERIQSHERGEHAEARDSYCGRC